MAQDVTEFILFVLKVLQLSLDSRLQFLRLARLVEKLADLLTIVNDNLVPLFDGLGLAEKLLLVGLCV